jgi:protein SCO1/2
MTRRFLLFCLLLLSLAISRSAVAQPAVLREAGIDQHLGESIPLDVPLRDDNGQAVTLGDCLHPGRPVLLTFVYYRCPMLCTTTLNQLTRSLTALPSQSAGDEFDVITVSIDPRETPELAAEKKRTYLRAYRRPTAEMGWHFMTGSQTSIDRLTKAAGFRYAWDEEHQVFAHAAAVIVLTPRGKISRYFLGVDYPPTELQQAMSQAQSDTVGPPAEAVFLYCFHYDPATGKYGLIIDRALHVLGVATLLGLVGLIGFCTMRGRHRQSETSAPAAEGRA